MADMALEADLANDATYDFIEQAFLSYAVPAATNVDLETAFKDFDGGKSIAESITQRECLFFGTLARPHRRSISPTLTCAR